jgi:hypothetical protein
MTGSLNHDHEQFYESEYLVKSIHLSQHCQRNFDLSRSIPEEHVEVLRVAATQCSL